MPLKPGYSRAVVNHNIAELVKVGNWPEARAVAGALNFSRTEFRKKKPNGKMPFYLMTAAEKKQLKNTSKSGLSRRFIAPRNNPISRSDKDAAADLSRRFMGREPDSEFLYKKPKIPDAMACIGQIFAIEYIAERDGKEYRFRHVFKVKSRPHLAVAPDGSSAHMIGGSWHFGQDGFEDT